MTLLETLTEDYKIAFKAREMEKKTILNMVLAEAKKQKIDMQKDLSDEEILKLIKKEAKAIKETMWYLEKAGKDLSEEELKLAVLWKYLPVLMSEEETRKVIENIIAELGIEDVNAERGKLMGAIMGKYKWKIDGGLVNKIVNS